MNATYSTVYRDYDFIDWSPDSVLLDALRFCRRLHSESELIFPIGRVFGTFGGVRFMVEKLSDRSPKWYLSVGGYYVPTSKKRVFDALESAVVDWAFGGQA